MRRQVVSVFIFGSNNKIVVINFLYFEKSNEIKVRERPRKTIVYLYMLNTDIKRTVN